MSKFVTPMFRLSFPDLFVPKLHAKAKPGAKPKFGLVMLFPKSTDLAAFKAFAKADMDARLGADFNVGAFNKLAMARNAPLFQNPFLDGDVKDLDGYAGSICVRASTLSKPGVVGPDVQPILDPEDIYAGSWCRASVDAYSWNNSDGAGVRFGLLNVQKIKDGERFGNRSKPEDDFEAVANQQAARPAAAQAGATRTTAKSPAPASAATAVDDFFGGENTADAGGPDL